MDNKKIPKIHRLGLVTQLGRHINDDLNKVLSEGYKIADIEPYYEKMGGAIFVIPYGVYVTGVMLTLRPSSKKTEMFYHRVLYKQKDHSEFNQIIEEESGNGAELIKIIAVNGFLDPAAESGIGRGTLSFCMFFTKRI